MESGNAPPSKSGTNIALGTMENTFLQILRTDSIQSIGKIGSEVAFDAVLDEGLLKDIAVVNTVCSLLKGARTVRDRLFFRKVVRFLLQLADISLDTRRGFVEELEKHRKQDDTAEILLNIVDKVDSSSKAALLGKILRSCILGEIDVDTMLS